MEQMRRDPNQPRGFVGTGHQQELTPDRQTRMHSRSQEAYDYAVKSSTHLWVVVMSHRATDTMLDAFSGETPDSMPILDMETLLDPPSIGCMVCEQVFEPRLRRRRCPGEPS